MSKKWKFTALGLAAVIGLTACGGSQPAEVAEQSADKAKPENIELTVSHYLLEEERATSGINDSYLTMVEEWEKAHPEVTVTQQVMAQSDYATKIQAQAAVNEMPDVFMVKGSWIENFVDNDIIAPIDDYLAEYEYKDNFREGVFDAATKDGKIYGVPNQLSITSVVYYNEELWKSIGYDSFPDNWDDIFAAAEKFNEQGIATIALGNNEKWPAESCILSTLGDRYTGSEWTKNIIARNDNAKFTDESFVAALARLQELAVKGVFNPDFNTITETQGVEYYSQGKAASVVSGHWSVFSIPSFAGEEILNNTKVAVLPSIDGSEAGSISGGCGWYFAVNKNLTGEKLDAAMDFALHTTGYEMDEYGAEKYGSIGAGLVEGVDISQFSQLTQDFSSLVDRLSFTPVYDLQMDGAVIEVMNTGLQELMNGSVTPEDLAARIQAEQEKLK